MAYAQENGLHNYHNEVNLGRENRWLKKGPEGEKRRGEGHGACFFLLLFVSSYVDKNGKKVAITKNILRIKPLRHKGFRISCKISY